MMIALLKVLFVAGDALIVIVVVVAVAVVVLHRQRAAPAPDPMRVLPPTGWRATHWSAEGRTHVGVERRRGEGVAGPGMEWREVAVIPDDAPDYDLRFTDAMATARVRAEILDAEDR